MTARARMRQDDVARVLRAARKVGAKRARVGPDGCIDILLEEDEAVDGLPDPSRPLVTIEDRPKKKLVF
jgi:hypothetical protein